MIVYYSEHVHGHVVRREAAVEAVKGRGRAFSFVSMGLQWLRCAAEIGSPSCLSVDDIVSYLESA